MKHRLLALLEHVRADLLGVIAAVERDEPDQAVNALQSITRRLDAASSDIAASDQEQRS